MIIRWLIDEFKSDQGIDLSGDPMAMRVEEEAEKPRWLYLPLSLQILTCLFYCRLLRTQTPKCFAFEAKLEQICDDLYARTKALSKLA